MIHNTSKESGFTLIEMLFYILFIVFIMGSTIGIVHQLLRNSDSLKTGINVEEEGNFILRKISWALNDSTVTTPFAIGSTQLLSVTKNGVGGIVTVKMDSGGGDFIVIDGGSGFKQLSNDRFVISNLTFERTGILGAELLKASFNIGSRSFEITRQIR